MLFCNGKRQAHLKLVSHPEGASLSAPATHRMGAERGWLHHLIWRPTLRDWSTLLWKTGHGLCDRSFLRKVLYATEPATFCSEPLSGSNSVLWEVFSAIQRMTHQEQRAPCRALNVQLRHSETEAFQRVNDKPQQPPRVLPSIAGDVTQHSSPDYNHS